MEAFPFTAKEWERIKSASHTVMQWTLVEDDVLRASAMETLRAELNLLRGRYGEHPVLLETEADFECQPAEQVPLYRRAIALYLQTGLPTYTARISLASLLLEDQSTAGQARAELLACQSELAEHADSYDQQEWERLFNLCSPTT